MSKEIVDKVKTAFFQFDPLGKHKEGLISWSKTAMPGGFTDVSRQDYDVLRKLATRYQLLGDQ